MVFILILGIFSGEIIAHLGHKKSSPNPSLILPRVSPPYHGICLPCSILSPFLADSTESLLQYKYYLCFSAFPKLPACELPWINQHRVWQVSAIPALSTAPCAAHHLLAQLLAGGLLAWPAHTGSSRHPAAPLLAPVLHLCCPKWPNILRWGQLPKDGLDERF